MISRRFRPAVRCGTGRPAHPAPARRPAGPARVAPACPDRGSATLELATGLPVVVVLLLAGLVAVAAVTTKLQCVDAAREGARAAARGESGAVAAGRAAPAGAEVTVTVQGDLVTAVVTAPIPVLGTRLPGTTVAARAVAAVEPGHPAPLAGGPAG